MPEINSGYLYILESISSGKNYLGSTVGLTDRLNRHNTNRVTATRHKGPWKYVAIIEFDSPELARKVEQWLKRMHRKDIIELIITGSFDWPESFSGGKYLDLS